MAFALGGLNCTCCGGGTGPGGPCKTTFTVRGCNGQPLSGVTVTVNTTLGALVETGTTDAAGQVILGVPAAGNYNLSATSPSSRFTNISLASRPLTCGGSSTFNFSSFLVAGYHCPCINACAWPISDTLHLTDSVAGSFTLTRFGGAGGGWATSSNGTQSGTCGCAGGGNVFMTYTFCNSLTSPGGLGAQAVGDGTSQNCPGTTGSSGANTGPSSPSTNCGGPTGGFSYTATNSSLSCAPSFGDATSQLYSGGVTWTLTE